VLLFVGDDWAEDHHDMARFHELAASLLPGDAKP
jgi:hypothetical protein